MDKYIAVLSQARSVRETLLWLQRDIPRQMVEYVSLAHNSLKLKSGIRFQIISDSQHVIGMEFDAYIVGPYYEDLRMCVMRRVIRKNPYFIEGQLTLKDLLS